MIVLTVLSPEDRDLLTGLLFRTGIWISHAEDEGGAHDDAREIKAIESVISGIAANKNAPSFVREIARETLSRKKQWPAWEEAAFDILPDCEKAIALLKKTSGKAAAKAYAITVFKVARAVAGAHGEFGEDLPADGLFSKIAALFGARSKSEDFMNISSTETESLRMLKAALSVEKE